MADDEEHQGFGFALPIPQEVVQAMTAGHDRAHMRAEARDMAIHALLDSLNVEQLMALRTMLNTRPDDAHAANEFYDGQILTILRLVHGVDPDTGKSPGADLLDEPPA